MFVPRYIYTNTDIREYNNGSAIYCDALSSVYADIIEEHYIKRYNNTVFMCTPCYPYFSFDENMITGERISKYARKVFCNFDQFIHEDYKMRLFDWCRQVGVTDIWEWQIPILQSYPDDLKRIVTFMPTRYVTKYESVAIQPVQDPKFLYIFAGNLMQRRYDLMQQHMCDYLPYKTVSGIRYIDNADEFKDCACALNIHSENNTMQESLRIHEFLCLNVPVVSEVSDVNYFGNLITEISENDIPNLYDLITEEMITINQSPAAGYKALTYTDEAFYRHRMNLLQFRKVI